MTQGFQRFWAGQSASLLGDAAMLGLFPLLAAGLFQAGPLAMSGLGLAQSLPVLLLALPAGVLADRTGRRRLLMRTDLVRGLAVLLLALGVFSGQAGMGWLFALAAWVAAAGILSDVAAQSALPSLVPPAGIIPANARLEVSRALGYAAAPAGAGLLLHHLGAPSPLLIVVALYALSAWFYRGLPQDVLVQSAPAVRLRQEIAEGIGFVARHPVLRPITLCALLWNVAWFVLNTVFVLYATERLGLSAADIGLILSAQGAGMVAGALLARRVVQALAIGPSLLVGPVISALAIPIMALASPGPAALPVMLVAQACFGIGPSVWVISSTSLRQSLTPPALMGRVAATLRFASLGMRPVGALIGGGLGVTLGLEATMAAAAVLFAACILPIALSPAVRLKTAAPLAG